MNNVMYIERPMRRPGFTLSELVIAVALLSLMMLLVGQVFTVTIRSTGQATALSEINKHIRLFEQQLQADLGGMRRGHSVLFLGGREVKAYWTKAGQDADATPADPMDGYPHSADPEREDAKGNLIPPRADVLAFFTYREGQSAVFPGISSNLQFVSYGHTVGINYQPDGSTSTGYKSDFIPDPEKDYFPALDDDKNPFAARPAAQWHLARRTVLLTSVTQQEPSGPYNRMWGTEQDLRPEIEFPNPDGDYNILSGLVDLVGGFDYEATIAGKTYFLPPLTAANQADGTDYRFFTGWFQRGLLDADPPAPTSERIGQYFMPNCASFKVEWTIDDPRMLSGDRILWFDSADLGSPQKVIDAETKRIEEVTGDPDHPRIMALNNLKAEIFNDADGPGGGSRFDPDDPELEEVPGLFFFPKICLTSQNGQCDLEGPDTFFPSALRITADFMDERGRLERPIRHVMVIPLAD